MIQSFAPGEVSYEEAHRIGKELADKVLGGRYEYVLTTHIDKGHIHICTNFSGIPINQGLSASQTVQNIAKTL